MIEPTYAIELKGFSDAVGDPIDALMRGFGVSAARAETILNKLPTVVKRKADAREALKYARALVKLGANVEVCAESTGKAVSLQELTGFERVRSNVIESADPAARRGVVPRAAFRSGSHPSIAFPKTAAGVALTPNSLGAVGATTPAEPGESGPSDANGDTPPRPSANLVGERVAETPTGRTPSGPLLVLEQGLSNSGQHEPARLGLKTPPPPLAASESLELDETAIPAGRYGGSVPAMPEVLRQIRDFEATGWDPLRPDVGLGSSEKLRPLTAPPPPSRPPTGESHSVSASRAAAVREPVPTTKAPSTTPKTGAFGGGMALAILVGALVVAVVYLVARSFGGVSGEVREALEVASQQYLTSLEITEVEGGSIGQMATEEFDVPVRAGRCYGFVATTEEPLADLDLYLFDGAMVLAQDIMVDNKPVIFHCPASDGQLRLRLANAGLRSASYGLAHLEGQGSIGWPLEPYLRLYADYLAGLRGLPSPTAVGPIGHGTLPAQEVDALELVIPSGHCYSLLAIAGLGSDLDLRLLVDGQLVDEDATIERYSMVGYCPVGGDVSASVEVIMYSGQGPYVHQVFELSRM